MEIGDKIKELRLAKGYTLEQLGNIVGVGKSTVRKWETGQISNMRRDKIAKLADALGVSPTYILGLTEEQAINASARRTVHTGISRDEYELVIAYRNATAGVKEAVRKLLDISASNSGIEAIS